MNFCLWLNLFFVPLKKMEAKIAATNFYVHATEHEKLSSWDFFVKSSCVKFFSLGKHFLNFKCLNKKYFNGFFLLFKIY